MVAAAIANHTGTLHAIMACMVIAGTIGVVSELVHQIKGDR